MAERVRHPRLLSAFRTALYLSAAFVATLLALAGVAVLGAILAFAAFAVLTTGDVNLLAVGGLAVLVVALVGVGLAALSAAVRCVERRVERADRLPDPLDELKREYVVDAIDERELERRLDGLLDADGRRRPPSSGGECRPRADDSHREAEDASA